jgi:hypothetical protein
MRNGFRPQRGASLDHGVDAMSFTAPALPAAQAQTPRRIALTEPAQEIANGRRAYAQWFIRRRRYHRLRYWSFRVEKTSYLGRR